MGASWSSRSCGSSASCRDSSPPAHPHHGQSHDGFVLRANGTDHEPGRKYAEDVYDLTEGILPGLKGDFEENKFRTPKGGDGSDGGNSSIDKRCCSDDTFALGSRLYQVRGTTVAQKCNPTISCFEDTVGRTSCRRGP